MFKLLLALSVLMSGLMIIRAQENSAYSESTPYEPRKFEETRKPKKENNEKPKTEEKAKSQTNESVSTGSYKSDTNIKIPLFVYDAQGNPVTDLKNSELMLLLDDREYEILSFEPAEQALDIVLVVDTSPSTVFKTDDIRNFVKKLAESLKPEDKIQIISFNRELNILSDATNDKEIIKRAVKKLGMGDGTSIYEAVETIFQKHLNAGQKTVIIMSDGVDTTSLKADYISSLLAAEKKHSAVFSFYLDTFSTIPRYPRIGSVYEPPIFNRLPGPTISPRRGPVVGMTKAEYDLGLDYLQDIARLSGGRTFQIKDLAEIKIDELKEILGFLKPQYVISFKPTGVDRQNQRKKIKLRINRPNLTVQLRGSYITQ